MGGMFLAMWVFIKNHHNKKIHLATHKTSPNSKPDAVSSSLSPYQ